VAARLEALGFAVPDPGRLPEQFDADNVILLSRDLDGEAPWLEAGERVPLGFLAAGAARTGRSVPEVAARLEALGFAVPDPGSLPEQLDDEDLALLSRDVDGQAPWLNPDEPVELGHLMAVFRAGRSVPDAIARLTKPGLVLPPALAVDHGRSAG
jgi:hypothetical protein